MDSQAPTAADLAYLEEYADTVVSLPHEIQRNFTLIREHDAKVKELNDSLYANIDRFLFEESLPDKPALVNSLKSAFLSTLTHAEEKVSLATQCFNTVEKHLIRLEEDLKCFEEEIRLAGYGDLLSEAGHQKRAALLKSSKTEESTNASQKSSKKRSRTESTSKDAKDAKELVLKDSKESKESVVSNPPKRSRRNSTASDNDFEATSQNANNEQLSRAERLLRRTKPAFQTDEMSSTQTNNEGDDESEENATKADDEQVGEAEEAVEKEEEADSKEEANEEDTPTEAVRQIEIPVEQVERRSTRSRSNSTSTPAVNNNQPPSSPSKNEPLYCTCKRVSFGQMIACDNKECPVEWFHYGCVGLKNPPKGKWYCSPSCQNPRRRRT